MGGAYICASCLDFLYLHWGVRRHVPMRQARLADIHVAKNRNLDWCVRLGLWLPSPLNNSVPLFGLCVIWQCPVHLHACITNRDSRSQVWFGNHATKYLLVFHGSTLSFLLICIDNYWGSCSDHRWSTRLLGLFFYRNHTTRLIQLYIDRNLTA